MKDNFAASLKLVLKSEGGNDDDPADHGGRTSRGITQREYSAWLAEQGRPDHDVWTAPDADIDAIYHEEYWAPWGDLIPAGTDYVFFDMCVNSGAHEAILLGQRALGVAADGRVGPVTRTAFRAAMANPVKLLEAYTAQKATFYRTIAQRPRQGKFLAGWLHRNAEVHEAGLAMIQGATNG